MKALITHVLAALVLATVAAGSPASSAAAAEPIGEAKLAAFVDASSRVGAIVERYNPRIRAAGTREEKAELVKSAKAEMAAAVQQTPDMTLDEYNRIAQAAQQDPELAKRIQTLAAERQGK